MLLPFCVRITVGGAQQIGPVLVSLYALQIYGIHDIPFLHITVLVFFKNILRHTYISSTVPSKYTEVQ
jgi:hypothetical protein